MTIQTPRRGALASSLIALALTLTACSPGSGDGSETSKGPNPTDAKFGSLLPEDVATKKVVTYATLIYPPWIEFAGNKMSGKPGGMQGELLNAMEPLLGVKFKPVQVAFPAMIPGVIAGRFDMIGVPINDTSEREKTVTFLDYATDKSEVTALKGNPLGLKTIEDLCGKTGAAPAGTTQVLALGLINDRVCKDDPIKIITSADSLAVSTAIVSGRADFSMNTIAGEAYALKTATTPPLSKLEIVPVPVDDKALKGTFPVGLVFQKSDTQLRDALKAALQELIDNGTYGEIMKKHDLTSLAVESAEVDQAAKYGV